MTKNGGVASIDWPDDDLPMWATDAIRNNMPADDAFSHIFSLSSERKWLKANKKEIIDMFISYGLEEDVKKDMQESKINYYAVKARVKSGANKAIKKYKSDIIQNPPLVTNEVKVGRGWSGKLSGVERLMSWLYDNDIMSRREKAQKDKIFNRYYRFYNDGDYPPGFEDFLNDAKVAEYLERELEEFITSILSKYWGKIDRTDIKFEKQIEGWSYLSRDRSDVHDSSSIRYFKQKVDTREYKELENLFNEYEKLDKKLKDYYVDDFGGHDNYVTSKMYNDLREEKDAGAKSLLDQIKKLSDEIEDIVSKVVKAFELARDAYQEQKALDF